MTNTPIADARQTVNPNQIPEEYTELACLLGFVQRLASRHNSIMLVNLCEAAHRGHPTAIGEILEMSASLIATIRSAP